VNGMRRWYAPTVLALVAGGGLTFVTMTRTWGLVAVTAPGLPDDEIAVSGAQALPVVSALGLVILASALAVLAGSARVRRALGALVVLLALGCLGWVAIGAGAAVESALGDAARDSASFTGAGSVGATELTSWRFATLASLLLAAVAGAVVVRAAPVWPTMSRRYEAPGARPADDETDMWKALDEGRDPTE